MQVSRRVIFEMQAQLCALMANPKRLMIMDFLSRMGEASVGAIADEIESSVSTASQHLRLMRDSNIVLSRRDGHTVFYRLKHPGIMDGCQAVRQVLLDEMNERREMAGAIEV